MSSERLVTLLPSLVKRIEECWHPSHFREVRKAVNSAFKVNEYKRVMIARLKLVIDLKPDFSVLETLQDMIEELEDEIQNKHHFKNEKLHRKHEDKMRILVGKKANKSSPTRKENKLSPIVCLTLQIYDECNRDLHVCAKRLGVPVGVIAQRIVRHRGKL